MKITRPAFLAALVAGLAWTLAGCATTANIYNTNRNADTVSLVSRATYRVVDTIAVGQRPIGIAVNSAGSLVYAANSGSDSVSVISTARGKVVATVAVGARPFGLDVNRDGTRVYVANSEGGTVSVIDTATNAVTASVRMLTCMVLPPLVGCLPRHHHRQRALAPDDVPVRIRSAVCDQSVAGVPRRRVATSARSSNGS